MQLVSIFSPFEKRTKKEIDQTINVNLIGTHNVIKNYTSNSIQREKLQSSRIINFGSIYGANSPDFRIYGKK